MLPLVVVWFVLLLVEAVFEDDSGGNENYSAENATRGPAAGGETSLLGVGLDALRKGVRMLVFLILPAIAWEDRRSVQRWDAATRCSGTISRQSPGSH